MFKERKSSFKKNMAFLVCVAFILMVFPETTHAATKPSSKRFPFPKESTSFISAVFSFASLNLSPVRYNLAFFYSLSNSNAELPHQANDGNGNKNDQKQNGSVSSNGNSTSKKPPEGDDNT